jgi:hypothetical protein
MYNREDFSLIIQGPLNETSLSNIDNYLKYVNKIIVSYWNGCDKNIENLFIEKYKDENVEFIKNSIPNIEKMGLVKKSLRN